MIRWIGSFQFAVILIAFVALQVIVGTVLEAMTTSHQLAEDWIYHNVIFKLLLLGFFLNILVSALLRWPFKNKHIPFLLTHLGLLMVIAGVFIKSVFGIQGHIQLIEGTATNQLVIDGSKALLVEKRFPRITYLIPYSKLTIVDEHPHAKVSYELPKFNIPEGLEIQVEENEDSLRLFTNDFEKIFRTDQLTDWVAYDEGFSGYTQFATLPLESEKSLQAKAIESELREHLQNAGAFAPPLMLIYKSCVSHQVDFPKALLSYLIAWDLEKSYLSSTPFIVPIDFSLIPKEDQNALYWIASLFKEQHFLEFLKEQNWPLITSLQKDPASLNPLFMAQIYSIKEHLASLPETIDVKTQSKMLSAYLRLFDLHYENLPKPIVSIPKVTVESPIKQIITKLDPPLKKEDAAPFLEINFNGENISLVFDKTRHGLKWPTKNGLELLRYQENLYKLPYQVRLHQASNLFYPGSDQTVSYECTLSLKDEKTNAITHSALKMNQVYETPDGFRFYLAGMGEIDPYGVKSVQLVVSQDPAKWWLTYPGALIASFGILLLFWKKKS